MAAQTSESVLRLGTQSHEAVSGIGMSVGLSEIASSEWTVRFFKRANESPRYSVKCASGAMEQAISKMEQAISKPKWCSGSALSSPFLPPWGGLLHPSLLPPGGVLSLHVPLPSSLPALTYNRQWKSIQTHSNQSVGNNNEVILGWDERHFKWGQGFKLLTRE